MPVSDYAPELNATATRLVWTPGDPPTYEPAAGATALPVAALPASGTEKVSIGKEIGSKVYKVFVDFQDGSPAFGMKDRVRLAGIPDAGDYEVLDVRNFEFGEDLSIVMCERYS